MARMSAEDKQAKKDQADKLRQEKSELKQRQREEAKARRKQQAEVARRTANRWSKWSVVIALGAAAMILTQNLSISAGEQGLRIDYRALAYHSVSLALALLGIVAVLWFGHSSYRKWRARLNRAVSSQARADAAGDESDQVLGVQAHVVPPLWKQLIRIVWPIAAAVGVAGYVIVPLYVDWWPVQPHYMTEEIRQAMWFVLPYALGIFLWGYARMRIIVNRYRLKHAEEDLSHIEATAVIDAIPDAEEQFDAVVEPTPDEADMDDSLSDEVFGGQDATVEPEAPHRASILTPRDDTAAAVPTNLVATADEASLSEASDEDEPAPMPPGYAPSGGRPMPPSQGGSVMDKLGLSPTPEPSVEATLSTDTEAPSGHGSAGMASSDPDEVAARIRLARQSRSFSSR